MRLTMFYSLAKIQNIVGSQQMNLNVRNVSIVYAGEKETGWDVR